MASGRFFTIDDEQAGQRIDNFLLRKFKHLPRSRIYNLLRRGEVRVNRKRTKPVYKLNVGDEVRVPPLLAEPESSQPVVPERLATKLREAIFFESDQLLVVNKPPGLAVHGGSGLSFGVIEMIRKQRPEARFLELVHRLDRETSGCLLIAKKRSVLRAVQQLWRDGEVKKTYLALVAGKWQGAKVNSALRKIDRSGERVVIVDPTGKPSLSYFQSLGTRPVGTGLEVSLMRVDIHTGRTHQIRVHAASSGYPVVGDQKYGDAGFNAEFVQSGPSRLFLHAHTLEFELPGEQRLRFQAPLPKEFDSWAELVNRSAGQK